MLASEFHRYLMDHDALAGQVPPNALIVFHVDGEDDFNEWHRATSMRNRQSHQPMLTVSVRTWRKHSLIADLDLVPA
jgi:hypothetical protein